MKLLLVATSALLLAFASCGDSTTPTATTTVVPVKRPPAPLVDAGVQIAEAFEYSYAAMGKRDPFRSSGPIAETGSAQNRVEVCDDVLCQYDLDELRLVAVVSGDANPIAMVEDRTGVGHLVRRNSKIGRQAGKVAAILKDCIVVQSFVLGADERSQSIRTNLCVSTEGQGNSPVLDLMNGKTRE